MSVRPDSACATGLSVVRTDVRQGRAQRVNDAREDQRRGPLPLLASAAATCLLQNLGDPGRRAAGSCRISQASSRADRPLSGRKARWSELRISSARIALRRS